MSDRGPPVRDADFGISCPDDDQQEHGGDHSLDGLGYRDVAPMGRADRRGLR